MSSIRFAAAAAAAAGWSAVAAAQCSAAAKLYGNYNGSSYTYSPWFFSCPPAQKMQSPAPYHCFLPSPRPPSQPRFLLLIILIIFIPFISQFPKGTVEKNPYGPMVALTYSPGDQES